MLPDDQAGSDGLYGHLAGVIVEVDVSDLRFLRDDLAEAFLHHVRVRKGGRIWPYRHSPAEALGKLPDNVVIGSELVHVLGVDDHDWALVLNTRNIDIGRRYLPYLLFRILYNSLSAHERFLLVRFIQ